MVALVSEIVPARLCASSGKTPLPLTYKSHFKSNLYKFDAYSGVANVPTKGRHVISLNPYQPLLIYPSAIHIVRAWLVLICTDFLRTGKPIVPTENSTIQNLFNPFQQKCTPKLLFQQPDLNMLQEVTLYCCLRNGL